MTSSKEVSSIEDFKEHVLIERLFYQELLSFFKRENTDELREEVNVFLVEEVNKLKIFVSKDDFRIGGSNRYKNLYTVLASKHLRNQLDSYCNNHPEILI